MTSPRASVQDMGSTPHAPGATAFANKVKTNSEREMVLAIRAKFATLPALQFAAWLDAEVERVHRQ